MTLLGARLNLCANCLQGGASGVAVGPTKGDQRDPYQDELPLCETCKAALLTGDLKTFAARYADTRDVQR